MPPPIDTNYEFVIDAFTDIWGRYKNLGFQSLAEAERVIFCTWQFVSEVNNGGIHQYFRNPSGEFATETVAALEHAHMPHAASLLRRAIAAFPDGVPAKAHDVRETQLRSLPDSVHRELLDELTTRFFDSSEDPYALQADYISRNRAAFVGSSNT